MEDFGQLLQAEIPGLRRYAAALVGDPSRADDLVQDSLERAWKKSHLWRRGSNMRAWVFTIMHNLHANLARKYHATPQLVPLGEMVQPPSRPAGQFERLELDRIYRALAELSDEQRQVVLLIGMEQMRYEEAAEVLQIPLGTVMSRLFRARERLRALMSEDIQPTLRRVK